ncbi:hypothetical protein JCM10207_005905 [Rhodosporidiobolus poonsookiae]
MSPPTATGTGTATATGYPQPPPHLVASSRSSTGPAAPSSAYARAYPQPYPYASQALPLCPAYHHFYQPSPSTPTAYLYPPVSAPAPALGLGLGPAPAHPAFIAALPDNADLVPSFPASAPGPTSQPLPIAPVSVPSTSAPASQRPGTGPGSRARWTPGEDAALVRLVKELPPLTWGEIGERMGRKGSACGMRWYKFLRARVEQEEAERKAAQGEGAGAAGNLASIEAAIPAVPAPPPSLVPSPSMLIGSSAALDALPPASSAALPPPPLPLSSAPTAPHAPKRPPRPRKTISSARTGIPVALATVPASSVAAPSSSSAPLASAAALAAVSAAAVSSTTLPAKAGREYLPPSAMVSTPPVPFNPNTVLRGRRTKAVGVLEDELSRMYEAPDGRRGNGRVEGGRKRKARGQGKEEQHEEPDEDEPRKKVKKRGNKVHVCPADNCSAAFKRPEHLRRHYKSVHCGDKPWPCTIADCGKTFSRKDNLQQHQALVHLVRALYHYPDGSTSADPPSPSSEAVVPVTFEAVEITRPSKLGQKAGRAKLKAAPGGQGGEGAHDDGPGLLPPLPAKMASTVVGLMSLAQHTTPHQHQHQHQVVQLPALPEGGFSVAPSSASGDGPVTATSAGSSGDGGGQSGEHGALSRASDSPSDPLGGSGRGVGAAGVGGGAGGGAGGRVDKRLRLTGPDAWDETERGVDAALQMLASASSAADAEAGGGLGAGLGAGAGAGAGGFKAAPPFDPALVGAGGERARGRERDSKRSITPSVEAVGRALRGKGGDEEGE